MKRFLLASLLVLGPSTGGYFVGAAQVRLASFHVTITTTDRGAGVKMTCDRGCAWTELTFGCGSDRADCTAQIDEYGVGRDRR